MELLTYTLLIIASFAGTLAGIFLANLAAEELAPSKKYLSKAVACIAPIMMFILLYDINIFYAATMPLILLILFIKYDGKYRHSIIYASSGGLAYASILLGKSLETFILIFTYGMMLAALEASELPIKSNPKTGSSISKKDNAKLCKNTLKKYNYYVFVALIFFLVFEYII